MASKFDCKFLEANVKTGVNIQQIFHEVVREILKKNYMKIPKNLAENQVVDKKDKFKSKDKKEEKWGRSKEKEKKDERLIR